MMTRTRALTFGLSLAAVLASVCALAEIIPISGQAQKAGRKHYGALVIGGKTAVRLKTSYQGLSPAERAKTGAGKLRAIFAEGGSISAIRAEEVDDRWTVSIAGTPFLYITKREARAQDSDPAPLARRWAAQIRALLSQPALKLGTTKLTIPFKQSRTVIVTGWAARSLKAGASSGANVAGVALKGRALTVRGIVPGSAKIVVSAGNHSAALAVEVKKYAGSIKPVVQAEVTGNPAPSGLVIEAAELAAKRFLPRERGASAKVIGLSANGRSLSPGRKVTLLARVRISGENYLPVEGKVRISVANVRVAAPKSSRLMYSNVPEQITQSGTLYFAEVPAQISGRLFYHHINSGVSTATLAVTLINPEDKPIRLQLVPGFVHPHPDPVRAGHRAGRAFFTRYLKNVGEIYTLPARSAVPIAVDLLKPLQVGSGIAELRILEPPSTRCYVRVTASFEPADSTLLAAAGHLDAWRRVLPRPATRVEMAEAIDSPDLYATAQKHIQAEYTVGDKWTWIPVGKVPVTDSAGTRRLEGNYGVIYSIDVKVHNPGEKTRQVEVLFEAGAGPASGVFHIGNQYVEVPSIYPREEKSLARFTMGPNETRNISIQTVPLGGSAYPAALIVR